MCLIRGVQGSSLDIFTVGHIYRLTQLIRLIMFHVLSQPAGLLIVAINPELHQTDVISASEPL